MIGWIALAVALLSWVPWIALMIFWLGATSDQRPFTLHYIGSVDHDAMSGIGIMRNGPCNNIK